MCPGTRLSRKSSKKDVSERPILDPGYWRRGGSSFQPDWRHRLINPKLLVPGISLVLAPLVAGLTLRPVGQVRTRKQMPSQAGTFRGGALFAFSMALIRLVWIGLR